MPTYEYACRACGHVFDIVQKMSDESLTICPECGGELRKVFAPPAISFKGSGFYATDHGKKTKPASDSGEDSKKTSSTKTDGGDSATTTPAKGAKEDAKKEGGASS